MNEQIRALFPITERAVYLNHAAVSPLPVPTFQAIQAQLKDVELNGSANFRSWVAVKETARSVAANLIGARPEQIAFMRNTSDGLSTVANGLKWAPGDNVVTYRREFPSNIYPWLRLRNTCDVEIRMSSDVGNRIDMDEMLSLIDSRTRVVSVSHVQYASGFRSNVRRLGQAARAHDALLVVDLIQGMGVLPINVEEDLIDAAAGASHKWLLAPEGVGLLYLSDRARDRIQPTLVGWISVPEPEAYEDFDQEWRQGALAWETGTGASALIHGLAASLQLITQTGVEKIAAYLKELTDYMCERIDLNRYEILSSRLPAEKSQIVCIRHRGQLTSLELYSHLKQRAIITAPRGGGLRVAPHFYNTPADIDHLLVNLP